MKAFALGSALPFDLPSFSTLSAQKRVGTLSPDRHRAAFSNDQESTVRIFYRFLPLLFVLSLGHLYAQTCPPPSVTPLRVGVLPVLNTLPTFVAQQQGFFDEAGIKVELVPLESARDRAIALQTGQIDVANSDAVATLLQVAAGDSLKIVRYDAFAPGYRFFSIVTGADSGLGTPEELVAALQEDRAQIAISSNTIIEYLATALLESVGYEPQANDYIEVSAIPVRLEQLAQGTVQAALLPEPLTTLATEVQGGTAVLDDSALGFVPVALTVTQATLAERPGDVCAFLQAYDRAVQAINANPETFRQNDLRVPDPVRATYVVPKFELFRVPTPAEIQEVEAWMLKTGLLETEVPYEDVVDGQFVPNR
ncbi:MetQ/NlpA family ABC transporter substrate-binding protein [soil metagenome]